MRHISRIVLFACVLIGAHATALRAAILTPNDVLQVRFTVAPASPTPDVLTISLGIVQVLAAHTSRTGALFDGNTLLGTGSTSSFGGHVGALSLTPRARGEVPPASGTLTSRPSPTSPRSRMARSTGGSTSPSRPARWTST